MEILVDKRTGKRLRVNRPYIDLEEYHYNTGIYDPYRAPESGLYNQNMGPDWLATSFQSYVKKNETYLLRGRNN